MNARARAERTRWAGRIAVLVFLVGACGDRPPKSAVDSSAAGHELAGPDRTGGPSPTDTPEALIATGLDLYGLGEYEEATEYLEAAASRAVGESGRPERARALTWLGLAAWRQGDFESARRLGEEALTLKLEAGLDDQLFRSYNALGLLAWYEARLPDALELFARATESAQAMGDVEGVGKAANNRGLIHIELGEFEAAREGFELMLQAGRGVGDPVTEGKALTNLGMLDVLLGYPRAAVPKLEQAIELYESADYATGMENASAQLATAYRELGDAGGAHSMLARALELAREQRLRPEEAADLEVLAELYRDAGDSKRALDLYAEAEAINTDLGFTLEAGADLRNQALIYADLGNLEGAHRAAMEALGLDREMGNRFEELLDHLALAEIAQLLSKPLEVKGHLREARTLARAVASRTARVELALTEARIADAAADPRTVLAVLADTAQDLTAGDYASKWEAAALRARAHLRLGQLDSAAASGREAVESVERVRRRFSSAPLRTAYAASRIETYSDLVTVLLRSGRTEEALEVADAARGAGLQAGLAATVGGRAAAHGGMDPAAAAARGEALLRQIDTLVARIAELELLPAEERDATTSKSLGDRLAAARRDYESQMIVLTESLASAAPMLGLSRARAAEIRAALSPDEALVEFLVTPDRLLIFVVTRSAVRIAESPVSADNLASRVRLASGLVTRPGADRERKVLESLHGLLIEPALRVAPLLSMRRLLLVPHGVLAYVPFAALVDRETGRYLVQDLALVNLPSAASLVALRKRVAPTATAERGTIVFAPFPDRYPASEEEARVLARQASDATSIVGDGATEKSVRDALLRGDPVHVATHGVMNANAPMFSRIELARGTSSLSEDDGRLEVHEILGLPIRSSLVFLSGCETGLGAAWSTGFEKGEDYATLDRAFLAAGAQDVVATLWRVDDEGASRFAQRFYSALAEHPAAAALAAAQREMIADRDYGSPFYWAPYRISGL